MGTPAAIAAQLRNVVKTSKRQAMQRAVLTVEGAAKRETPGRTGNLRRTLTSRVEQGGNRGVVGTNAVYARRVHEGFPKHLLYPRVKKALFWKGASHPVRVVKHPGNKPNRFLVRAAESSRGSVERELAGHFNGVLGRIK